MSIIVIGTFTRDTNLYLDRPPSESIGGILYNVVALASLLDDIVVPVANVGADLYDELVALLARFPNVALDGLRKTTTRNHHCYLFFVHEYPGEVTLGGGVPIQSEQVTPFLSEASMILVNMVAGYDLSLSTLASIRRQASCPIYLDYHLLGLGQDVLGNRYLRKRRNWRSWIGGADIVQLNEFEATHLLGQSVSNPGEAMAFGRSLIALGPHAAIVTLGAAGSVVTFDAGAEPVCQAIPVSRVGAIKDTAGCGDVYSAGFVAHYSRHRDIVAASHQAAYYAGRKCMAAGALELADVLGAREEGADRLDPGIPAGAPMTRKKHV